MARRKKTTPAEDLVALVASLSWWAGVALAIASFLLLHRLVEQPWSSQPGRGRRAGWRYRR